MEFRELGLILLFLAGVSSGILVVIIGLIVSKCIHISTSGILVVIIGLIVSKCISKLKQKNLKKF